MRRLHLRLYFAIVGMLMLFLFCGASIWHHFSPPRAAVAGVEGLEASVGVVALTALDPASVPAQVTTAATTVAGALS